MDTNMDKILEIANRIKLSATYIEFITEYLDHGEWGLAFETLCSAIDCDKIQISSSDYNVIEQMGNYMEMDRQLWQMFKSD